jgi:VWA domain containing CoxE-like protein
MPHPSNHLHPATAAGTRPDRAWRAWDEAWTKHIKALTGRTDLTVTVAPGAGAGAPACFYPDTRRVEVDATYVGTPDVADPRRAAHKRQVPTAYGLLVHEAGHAAHSRWLPVPPGTPPIVADAALLLEESRAESHQRARRRGDRRWLRHTVTTLLTGDEAPVDDPWHAGQVAGLLLARVDARIITAKDVRTARAAVLGILGRQCLAALRDIWRAAHTTADTDTDTMIELGWRWCRTLGIDPTTHPDVPVADLGVFAGQLAAALADLLAADQGITASEYLDRDLNRQLSGRYATPPAWPRRDSTTVEQDAARKLAARLRRARTDNPEPARQPSVLPPGRLRTRVAITADAQRAAGAIPTAAPWQRRAELPPDKPTLHLGILVDLSGSMSEYATALSSAGWMLAHAAHRNQAVVATIGFSDDVTVLVPPRQRPQHVLQMQAGGGTSAFVEAVKLANRLLELRNRRRQRLLAVVSDGWVDNPDATQKLLSTLHRSGCGVLWLAPADQRCRTFADTTTIAVADPAAAIEHIAAAAITALTTA